jgi:hypothetical protein
MYWLIPMSHELSNKTYAVSRGGLCTGVSNRVAFVSKRAADTYDGGGKRNALYPKTPAPRTVAGGPLADNGVKCQLKPVRDEDFLPRDLLSGREAAPRRHLP